MTHRSRAGGPSRQKPKSNGSKNRPRKLHHPPSFTSKPPSSSSSSDDDPTEPSLSYFLTSPTDPIILELIHQALRSTIESLNFLPTVHKIKSLLYNRKWLEVFGDEALLQAYAGRWVLNRALCFRELFASLVPVRALFTAIQEGGEDRPCPSTTTNILSLGGGAGSELIAFASLIHAAQSQPNDATSVKRKDLDITWTGMDIAAWQPTLDLFAKALQTNWNLSLPIIYIRTDLLTPPHTDLLKNLATSQPKLITLLFTLTELLTQSRSQTISLLHHLTIHTKPGCLFLVADSASDLSSFKIGDSGRKWPVWMVLDAILLRDGGDGWEKVKGEDSRWYRLPEGVGAGWKVKLENTRYWFRLYRRS